MVAPGEQLSRLLRARFECEKGHIAEPGCHSEHAAHCRAAPRPAGSRRALSA